MEKNKPLRILFILPEYYPHSQAGISTYYLHYINAIKPYVSVIKVLVGSGYTQADQILDLDGVCIEYLKPRIYKEYLAKFSKFELLPDYRNNIAAAWAMWHQCNQGEGFDLIECTDFGLGFIPWLINHNKPIITRLHGSAGQIEMHEPHLGEGLSGDLYRHTEMTLLGQADALITHSNANKMFWESILGSEVQLILPIFQQQRQSKVFGDKSSYGIVAGRIQEWKGPDVLCKALAELKDLNLDIRWYGRDTSFDNSVSKSAALSKAFPGIWGNQIKAQNPVNYSELQELQQKAKFAIIPSTWDMYNLTGLEYLDAGTVLICSDGAGVAEIIDDGINGLKYSKDDYHALADCIKKAGSLQKIEYERIVNNGKATLDTNLSPAYLIEINLQAYSNVIANFNQKITNAFHATAFEPNNAQGNLDVILNKQPVKKLVNYLFNRLRHKLR